MFISCGCAQDHQRCTKHHRAILRDSWRAALEMLLTNGAQMQKISQNHVAQFFFNSYNYSLRSMSRERNATTQRVQATPRTGIVSLFLWRGRALVSQLRDDKQITAPDLLYGGRTVAKKKKAAKKAGGAKKGAKKKKSAKKKSR